MFKQSVIYLILSFLVVLFAIYIKRFLIYVNLLYAYMNNWLSPLFGTGLIGDAFKEMFTLILTPLALAAIPALLYWLIKRKKMPHFLALIWSFWLILALSSYLMK